MLFPEQDSFAFTWMMQNSARIFIAEIVSKSTRAIAHFILKIRIFQGGLTYLQEMFLPTERDLSELSI